MTKDDRLDLLRKKVAETSQAEVARRTGYQATTINQVLHGKYPGSPDTVLKKVEEVYSQDATISCPVLGDITPGYCAEQRNLPFSPDQISVALRRTCPTCPNNPNRKDRS